MGTLGRRHSIDDIQQCEERVFGRPVNGKKLCWVCEPIGMGKKKSGEKGGRVVLGSGRSS